VLECLATLVESIGEPAGLWVMVDDGKPLTPTIDRWRARGLVHASTLNALPGAATRLRRWLLPLYPRAVDDLSSQLAAAHTREPIDLLITTSSSAIKNLRSPEREEGLGSPVPHLCICFAPARYVWSRQRDYVQGHGLHARLRAIGLSLASAPFRAWDRSGSAGVTEFLAISGHVQHEIARCYERTSEIVFPPARTGFFSHDRGVPRENFWLIVSALEPYKRVDLAIDAARAAGRRLLIAGSGSHERSLRAHAAGGSGIEFLGRVSEEHLRDLYRRARLLLFPQIEDFGIVAVEAQACGCPVVARAAGGAIDIVRHGETGVLFDEPEPEALARAALRAEQRSITAEACVRNASRFSCEAFDRAMIAQVWRVLATRWDRTQAAPAG